MATTLFGATLLTSGNETSLNDLVISGIGWQFVAAIALLLGAIAVFRWRDVGFVLPHSVVRTMWVPSLYLVVFLAMVLAVRFARGGALPARTTALIAINCMMVGFSEETMFRGVLFRALKEKLAIWPAVLWTSALFGAVHLLNVFITGQLLPSMIQAISSGLIGLVFMAIVLRTGSLWPAIIYHGLWDGLVFLLGMSVQAASESGPSAAKADSPTWTVFVPLILNLPNLVFALIMLRNIAETHGTPAGQPR